MEGEKEVTTQQPRRLKKVAIIPAAFIVMWSSGPIFAEYGLKYASPIIFLFLRLFISALMMWVIVYALKTVVFTNFKEWGYILLTGLFMQVGYQVFFFMALDDGISPGILTIILGAQPIITTMITREKNALIQWIGLLLGMIGLILVVGDHIMVHFISVIGILSAILSLAGITIGTLMQKRIQLNQPTNMAIQFSGSAIILLFLVLITHQSLEWTLVFSVSLMWMVLIVSVGATLLLYYMIQKGNLTSVTSLFYCVPPVTVILDYFVFGNTISLVSIAGMGLIIAGLVMVNKMKRNVAKG